MADTQRTLTSCLALLANNTNGEISPQDIRDTVVSIFNNYAAMWIYNGSTTQVIGTSLTKMTGFAVSSSAGALAASTSNSNIAVSVTGKYFIFAQLSYSGSANTTFAIFPYVTSTGQQTVGCKRKLGSGGDAGSASFGGIITLTAGDTVELQIMADSEAKDFLPIEAQFVLIKIG